MIIILLREFIWILVFIIIQIQTGIQGYWVDWGAIHLCTTRF